MKQTISFKSFITFLTLFAAFTALSSLSQISASFAGTYGLDLTCKDSQRGVRCGYFETGEIADLSSVDINRFIAQIQEFCSTTARGSRCINKNGNVALLKIDELESGLLGKASCANTVRGTRCMDALS